MKLDKSKIKDILVRAGKTFVQAFFASLAVNSVALQNINDFTDLKNIIVSICLAGVSAGFSAIWNYVLGIINKYCEE